MTEGRKTRVMLVDDHEIVRLGLLTLINDRVDMEVVGEAGDAASAAREAERLKPDVILMDIRMPGEGGIEATRQIMARMPEMRIVMLTSFADDELLVRAISAGAVGYVLKQVGNAELLRAITAAARGEALLDPRTTARLLTRVREADRKDTADAFRELSDREMDVLAQVARGLGNAEIGEKLNLSEKTVRNYISTMFEKLSRAGNKKGRRDKVGDRKTNAATGDTDRGVLCGRGGYARISQDYLAVKASNTGGKLPIRPMIRPTMPTVMAVRMFVFLPFHTKPRTAHTAKNSALGIRTLPISGPTPLSQVRKVLKAGIASASGMMRPRAAKATPAPMKLAATGPLATSAMANSSDLVSISARAATGAFATFCMMTVSCLSSDD
jgi:DNA-binding NarL/FixJ family response regulator